MPVEKWPYFRRKVSIEREKVQPVTENVVPKENLFSVSIEENPEVAVHVGFVKSVFHP